MRINHLIIIFAALATLAGLLSGCFSPTMGEIPASSVLTEEAKGGNFELSFIVPNYRSWDFSQTPGARVIDPQTNTAVVTVFGGMPVGIFTYLVDGTRTYIGTTNSYSWELNITLPIWNYSPGDLEVTLKDSGGTTP